MLRGGEHGDCWHRQTEPPRERWTLCDQPSQRWAGQIGDGFQLEAFLDQRDHPAGSGPCQDCGKVAINWTDWLTNFYWLFLFQTESSSRFVLSPGELYRHCADDGQQAQGEAESLSWTRHWAPHYRSSGVTTPRRKCSAGAERRSSVKTSESSRPRAAGRTWRRGRLRWTTGWWTSSSQGRPGRVPSTALVRLETLWLSTVE